ncbi:hypothetical protein [Streptomyces sp. 2132.2]|uniref:hypothetical protein n=1 Tax=Streptomyces sp. 2132.2 TaxID=2485161 RepID=UPI000F47B4F9|nr:hypothetical protein [Streptomyces sp. 2132.2]
MRGRAEDLEQSPHGPVARGIIDTAVLPSAAASQLTGAITRARASGSYRAQRVLDTLDAHPDGAAGATLGTWPALVGPA